jgi:hypothetical protein
VPSAGMAINTLKISIVTEKVIMNVSKLLEIIQAVRNQVLVHDCYAIVNEADRSAKTLSERSTAAVLKLTEKEREVGALIKLANEALLSKKAPG